MPNYWRPKTQNGNRICEAIGANWTQNLGDPFADNWWTASARTYAEAAQAEKSSELRNHKDGKQRVPPGEWEGGKMEHTRGVWYSKGRKLDGTYGPHAERGWDNKVRRWNEPHAKTAAWY